MLHLRPSDSCSDIIVRAGLFSEIPITLCAGAVAHFLIENGCKIRMPNGEFKVALVSCMELFQVVTGPDKLDGELMASFLLNLQECLSTLKQAGHPKDNINWKALSVATDDNGKRLVSDLTISRLKSYFLFLKENDQIIVRPETIYHLILPIVIITAKQFEELRVCNEDLTHSWAYKIATMPSKPVLWMLERFCLDARRDELFRKKIDLKSIYIKYFFQMFQSDLPPLAFYPQPRTTINDKYADFVLNRGDIRRLAEDAQLKALHQTLLNLARQIRRLSLQINRNSLLVRLVGKLNVFDIESLLLVGIVDQLKDDVMLRSKCQNVFVVLFAESEGLLGVKAKEVIASKKEQAQKNKIIQFVKDLKSFLNSGFCYYPDTVEGVSKSIKDMLLKCQDIIKLPLSELELYKLLQNTAQKELSLHDYPIDDGLLYRPFDLHGAICFASSKWLEDISKVEEDIEKFVRAFCGYLRWHFQSTTNELKAIDAVLACYRGLLKVPQPAHVLFRQAVIIAKKEYESVKSLKMQANDVRRVHEGVLTCNEKMLLGLEEFKESVDGFISDLEDFLNHQEWKSLDASNDVERTMKSALANYQAVFKKNRPEEDIFNELTTIAERELRVIADGRAKLYSFFNVTAADNLVLLHNAIFDRDEDALDSLIVIWSNNIRYREVVDEVKGEPASPISLMH